MAYSSSDKLAAVASEFDQSMAKYVPTWNSFVEVIDTQNTISLQRYADYPIAALQTWVGGSTDITEVPYGGTHARTVTLDGKGSRVVLTDRDVRADSGLIDRKISEMFDAATQCIESSVYDLLSNTFTSVTVPNGSNSTTAACSAGHQTNVDQGADLDGEVAQSNLLTAALGYDSLNNAVSLGMRWTDMAGGQMSLFQGGTQYLIVSPENRAAAHRLCASADLIQHTSTSDTDSNAPSTATLTGNANVNAGMQYIVSSHLGSSPDWWIIDPKTAPIKLFMPWLPRITVDENRSNHTYEIVCSAWMQPFVEAPVAGLVGSNVA